MGITGLLPFVKKASRNSHIKHFSGQTAAVDAYGWLYKGAFGCAEKLGKGEPTNVYVTYCMKYVNVLITHGVKPVLVFDGRNLPAKAVTDEKRRKSRKENETKAKEALRQGKPAWEYFTRCLNVTPAMARELIKVLREQKIDYIIAPYEADAQLAYLARKGIVDVVITEDSDLVLFGCPKILFKMSLNGDGVLFDQSRIHLTMNQSADKFQFEKFRQMCILSGCDYLPSLPGIGLGRAKKVFEMSINQDVRKVLFQIPTILKLDMKIPDDYIEQFVHADNTFKYQLIFDPTIRSLVPLTPYPPDVKPNQLEYAGKYEKNNLALDFALGNVDIHTNERVDNFYPENSKSGYTKNSIWVKGYEISKKINSASQLKTNTKHSSTNGLRLAVSISRILPTRPRHKLEEEGSSAASTPADQDLMLIYGNGKVENLTSDRKNEDKRQIQEGEDDAIVTQSRRRSKRICLSTSPTIYKVKEHGIGSDGESEPNDSNEEFEEDTVSLENLKTERRIILQNKLKNPFLKSPQVQIKKYVKVTSPSPLSSASLNMKSPLPICLVERNCIYSNESNVIVKSKYFKDSAHAISTINGVH